MEKSPLAKTTSPVNVRDFIKKSSKNHVPIETIATLVRDLFGLEINYQEITEILDTITFSGFLETMKEASGFMLRSMNQTDYFGGDIPNDILENMRNACNTWDDQIPRLEDALKEKYERRERIK